MKELSDGLVVAGSTVRHSDGVHARPRQYIQFRTEYRYKLGFMNTEKPKTIIKYGLIFSYRSLYFFFLLNISWIKIYVNV